MGWFSKQEEKQIEQESDTNYNDKERFCPVFYSKNGTFLCKSYYKDKSTGLFFGVCRTADALDSPGRYEVFSKAEAVELMNRLEKIEEDRIATKAARKAAKENKNAPSAS
jgi:hypothetical protein